MTVAKQDASLSLIASLMGKRGGAAKTPAKAASSRRNIQKAIANRWKKRRSK